MSEMLGRVETRSMTMALINFMGRVYHDTVHNVRISSGNAPLGILNEMVNTFMYVGMFYLMYQFVGMRSIAIRGDFLLFLLSGVSLFLLHNRAISSVMSAADSAQPIMLHAPMTTMLSILSNAFSGLYFQVFATAIILFFAHVLNGSLVVDNPAGIIIPVFTAWSSGIAIGLVFLTIRPLAPRAVNIFSTAYRRLNMLTSSKFIPASYLPLSIVPWFDWNPLFHVIDQTRDAVFINYTTSVSSVSYPVYFTLVFMLIGLMGEFWMRKNISASWGIK